MRYLAAPALEARESEQIPAEFGKTYTPSGAVTLPDDLPLDGSAARVTPIEGQAMAIAADTASWSFLTGREAAWLAGAPTGATLGELRTRWPADALGPMDDFVARLYRRGLVMLGGQAAVDSTIFADSPNLREGHLVELLITEKCNLACGYCLAGASQRMPHMDEAVARQAIDRAFAIEQDEGFTFEFSGGEPFLRYTMMRRLVDHIRDHPARRGRSAYIALQTNGTLLDAERVQWMRESGAIVGLSLDGNPASHNLSRPQVNGGESFSKVMRGIDLMQRAGIGFGALLVLNRSNIGDAEAMIDFLVDNGIEHIKLNAVAYLGTARSGWNDVGITQDEALAYSQAFAQRVVERGERLFEANLFDMVRHLVSKQRHSRCIRGHCGAGDTFSAVAADGSIYPCGRATQSPGLKLGRVQDSTEALNAPAARSEVIRWIRERRPLTLDDCSSCLYRELCQAGCAAQAFERYGTVRHKTPECHVNKSMYPFLMHWLTFDDRAITHFNQGPYFGDGSPLVVRQRQFLPD
ncbi:MAG: radical SAM protein [Betaproteobacteria bacterium]